MPSEALISILTEALNKLVNLSGNAENTRIVPNLEVVDANPAGLTGYLIFRNDQDFNGPALKLPGITYTNGDLVNVLFMRGTEPVAMQQGSRSGGSNAGAPADAQYLTLAVNAGLTNERVFTPNAPLTPTDGGAGGLYELDIDAATEIAAGVAPIATQAETNAGVNDTKFITPLKLETRLATVSGLVYQVYDSTLTNVVIEADAVGNIVFNDSGADRDWRMESSINANALFLRGSDGALGLGTSNPLGIFHTVGDAVNINPNWTSYGYGAAPTVVGVRTRGTEGSPTAVQNGDSIWLWTGYGYETTTPALRLAASISFEVASPSGADVPCDIVYRTHASGDSAGSVTERMRLLSGGALMVGGTTQQTTGSKLELHRSGEVYLSLYNTGDTTAERGGYISWYTSGSNLGARIGAYRESGNSTGGNIVLLTQPVGGSLTGRVWISSTGFVGVNTGGPATLGSVQIAGSISTGGLAALYLDPTTSGSGTMYGLRVVGQAGVTGFIGIGIHGGTNLSTNWVASIWIGNEANRPGISIGYASGTKAPTHGIIIAGNSGFKKSAPTHTLELGDDDAAKTTTTTWTTTSDGRAKRNITPYRRGLADVMALPSPVEFEFNGEFGTPAGQSGVGFVAQELAPIAPEMIRQLNRDGERALGVNPNNLIYMLVNAVRELSAEVDRLKGDNHETDHRGPTI